MLRLPGKISKGGTAYGKAFVLEETYEKEKPICSDCISVFEHSLESLKEEIRTEMQTASPDLSEILEVTLMLAEDEGLIKAIRDRFAEGLNYVDAIVSVTREKAELLEASEDAYLSCRAEDIRGIGKRLVQLALSKRDIPKEAFVLVAEELSPAVASSFAGKNLLGIVTNKGSKLSHVSIMAGLYKVPYIYGVDVSKITSEDWVFIDEDGVFVNPDKVMTKKVEAQADIFTDVDSSKLALNISSAEDLERLSKLPTRGVGLFRTEFLFMAKERVLTEEEQLEAYSKVIGAFDGRPVSIRLLDCGYDKEIYGVKVRGKERGIEVLFNNPLVLKTQLRAILRGAEENTVILLPMVDDAAQVERLGGFLKEVRQELSSEGIETKTPLTGAMIESKKAVENSLEIASACDQISIGTNDLMRELNTEDYSAVIEAVRTVVENAHKMGKTVCVCGEMAADREYGPRLLDMGVDVLSRAL